MSEDYRTMNFRLTNCRCSEEQLHFLIPPNLPATILTATQNVLAPANMPPPPPVPSPVEWQSVSAAASTSDSPILTVNMPPGSGLPKQLAWHRRGDYVATVGGFASRFHWVHLAHAVVMVGTGEGQGGVWIHQLSRRHSQAPFKKIKGTVQLVLFHPTKPHFFVAVSDFFVFDVGSALPFFRPNAMSGYTILPSRSCSRHCYLASSGYRPWMFIRSVTISSSEATIVSFAGSIWN